jgi:hypothetical protein
MALDDAYASSSDRDEDYYLSDQEEDALEEDVLHGLEDDHIEECRWSESSVILLNLLSLSNSVWRARRH